MGPACNSMSEALPEDSTSDGLRIPDDAALLKQIRHGDAAAFRSLVDRHARYLYGIAYSICQNAADAEDVVQETLVGVLNGNFRGESTVRTWMVQILVRQAAMLRRKKRAPSTRLSQSCRAPADRTAGSQAKLDLAVMLESLSEEHREVIILREIEQLSYEEMAAALHVPRGTVESRLHRARSELRERFKDYFA